MIKDRRWRKRAISIRWLAVLGVLAIALALLAPRSARADGNGELNQSFVHTLQGDVVSAGVGLRGVGTANIALSGIPSGAEVVRAYLYWATLGSANTYTNPTLEAQSVNGELIGTSADTCWGVQHNFVYRADVTDIVTGDGLYTIAGLPGSLPNGNDSQGASLVVVYSDASEPFRDVVINDGAVTLDLTNNVYTDTLTGFVPDSPVTDADVTYLIGDGQSEWDPAAVSFEGTPIGSGVFTGVDGDFWGTLTFDVTNLSPDAPADTTIDNTAALNGTSPDCLLWAATIFSTTTGAPAEAENDLSRFFEHTLHGDVTSAGVGLRGTGSGDIVVSGIPAGAGVARAFLYWATLGGSDAFTSPAIDGFTVNGEVIGVSADTCWGAANNFTYRADVTDLIDSNGVYTISGLPDSLATGNDSQGASLVIVYATDIDRPRRTIVINDGAVTLDFDTNQYTDTITGFVPDTPVTESHVTYLIGDGQSVWDNGDVLFEGTSIANNVFNGVDGDYWGDLTFDVTALSPSDPASTTIDNEIVGDEDSPDCLLWAATVFSVTAPEPAYAYFAHLPVLH